MMAACYQAIDIVVIWEGVGYSLLGKEDEQNEDIRKEIKWHFAIDQANSMNDRLPCFGQVQPIFLHWNVFCIDGRLV